MTAAYFEDHPTDPEKVILRKPPFDQGADYERGFIDGMQKQMQSSVDKAVNHMAQTQEPPKYSFKAHWEKDGRIGVVAAIVRSDGGVHILEDIIDMPQRTEQLKACVYCGQLVAKEKNA